MVCEQRDKSWTFSRDGLLEISFTSNVRDIIKDIARKHINSTITLPRIGLVRDEGEQYKVSNSVLNFNINNTIPIERIYEFFTIPLLKEILHHLGVPFLTRETKPALIQKMSRLIIANPTYEHYVRRRASTIIRTPILSPDRDVNTTLLISNKHLYKKSDFSKMSYNSIINSLFDKRSHEIFVYEKVLGSKTMPLKNADLCVEINKKRLSIIDKYQSSDPTRKDLLKELYVLENNRTNKILISNTKIVLDRLFGSGQNFYIDKQKYVVLGWRQEIIYDREPIRTLPTGTLLPERDYPRVPDDLNNEFDLIRSSPYVNYPVKIHLELSEKPFDTISKTELQKVKCHLDYERIRKNWHDIFNKHNSVFERKYTKTIKKNLAGGRKSRKLKRKTRRKS